MLGVTWHSALRQIEVLDGVLIDLCPACAGFAVGLCESTAYGSVGTANFLIVIVMLVWSVRFDVPDGQATPLVTSVPAVRLAILTPWGN
jgi:hypothetical protein